MSKLFVIIDNGHGKETPGKCSPDSFLREWSWNRYFALALSIRLNNLGIPNTLLVPEEKDISLTERCQRANDIAKTIERQGMECILISIHVNAAKSDGNWHDASGWTVWVYNKASKKSRKLAHIFGQKAEAMNLTGNRYYPDNKYFEANFKILRETSMPAVLCENMFMDNHNDVNFLMSEEGKKKLLELYQNSILLYESTLI